jgi:Serine dehydrogenase proteinase
VSSWNDALLEFQKEVQREQQNGPKIGEKAAWAKFLYPRIKAVADYTGRPFVVYATACTSSGRQIPPGGLQIDISDKLGFHEVTHRLKGEALDLLIHSPGGSPDAAESIVEAIRSRFAGVRIIVPSYAKSAATMMAMSAEEIVLAQDAELGPIDPQMITANGYSPAEAIKEQFLKAGQEIGSDPKRLSVWIPILQQMGPSLLVQCDNAITLSKNLVQQWLTRFMFAGDADAQGKAKAVADYLGQHSNFKSHGRCIRRSELVAQNLGLKLVELEADKDLYDKVWAVYCALDVIFGITGIYKVFYNSNDQAVIRAQAVHQMLAARPMIQQPKP